jgi:large subunit ribosomal protein L19
MNELIQSVERRQLRQVPEFRVGDRVRVHFQVIEGNRRRTQVFEGVVLKIQGKGARRTFTVRKLSFGIGVERTFPVHSPKIERIEVAARGEVRRAKLYYLRGRVGRRARVRESREFRPEDVGMTAGAEPEPVAADGAARGEAAEEMVEAPEEETAAAEEASAADEGQAPEAEAETPEAETTVEAPAEGEAEPAEEEQSAEGEEAKPEEPNKDEGQSA